MTNISKRQLKTKHKNKLRKQLTDLFATTDKKTSELLFADLFTESEQTMFIKRLAIIIMVDKGYSKYRIAKTLLMSESTVREIWSKNESGTYNNLIKTIHSKQFDSEAFWITVEILLRGGLPPRGKGRWKPALKKLMQ